MNGAFDSHILAEKLSKLNNTQQSIETLSHWCIFHRKKAKLAVETWEKQFNSSEKEQRISFLYLANDILQNSRRKGLEFVGEFWKVLPAALKAVLDNGDDRGKNIVTRLVDIWEERKVFGSRTRSLKEDMLGSEPPPPLETSRKSSRSVRIVRRDPHSVKVKLAVGGTPEKVVSAFQSMHSEHSHEEMALNKCKVAISHVTRMEKDIGINFPLGEQKKTTLSNELQEQEDVLKQCIDQLGTVKATRETLVTQLKDALQEQESKLEHVRTQLQVAQASAEQSASMRQKLSNGTAGQPTGVVASETTPGLPALHQNGQPAPADVKLREKENRTAAEIAAEVAAKLAASTSSAQMLTSVLSSFAAEEAKSAGLKTSTSHHPGDTFPNLSPAKRVKLEKQTVRSDGAVAFFTSPQLVMPNLQQQPLAIQQPSASNVQGQVLTQQPTYALLPQSQHYVQTQGTGMIGLAYNYSSSTLAPPPPPPPLPSQMIMARPAQLAHQPSAPSFQPLQPPPMGFYGQSNQPTSALGPH